MATTRLPIPTVGGSYQHDSMPFDAQLTINMFVERGGAQSKAPGILRRTPGLKVWKALSGGSSGSIRGMYKASNGRFFVVRYSALIEVDAELTETSRGTINTTFGRVTMTDNGAELAISDGTNIYYLTFSSNTLATVTAVSAPDDTPTIDFADGYIFGFSTSEGLGIWRHSDINDVSTWDALDAYTAEGSPDKLVTLKVLDRDLWLFGSQSYEVWYNAGGDNTSGNPTWARIEGSFTNIGCVAPNSVSVIRSRIFWLGSSKDGSNIIWMSGQGYQPTQISNKGLESQIAAFTDTSDAWSFTFEYQGHFFYAITFQTGNKTFLYDVGENDWVNWAHMNTGTGVQERHLATNSAFFDRKNLVSDSSSGNIYELDIDTYTDNGDPIVCDRYFSHFEDLKERLSWYELHLDVLTGTALASGQGSDPILKLRWSDDGGYTFGNWHQMKLGARGKYETKVIYRMLGQSQTSRTYHLRFSEPIKFSIQDKTIAVIEASNS